MTKDNASEMSTPSLGAQQERMPLAIMFDVDETLISTGGVGARSWRYAFDRLHGVAADIDQFTEPV